MKKSEFDHPFFTDTDNYIKKQRIKYAIIVAVLLSISVYLFNDLHQKLSSQTEQIKSLLGKKVLIESDTLMIIDYSSLKNTYSLSDGKEYDMDLVKVRLVK
jgi:hypothetical protein